MTSLTSMCMSSTVKLSQSGITMPVFGLGLGMLEAGVAAHCAKVALQEGYRLLDSAQMYENEAACGQAVKESQIPREEIFVVSKVLSKNHGTMPCKNAFKQSLKKFGLDYIDLFLIHAPIGKEVLDTYDVLLELQKQGLIRAVGVSNFGIHHLEALREAGRPTPDVNQIELHPFLPQDSVVEYCQQHNIAVMGYCPVARMQKKDHPTLVSIAKKHKKSVAQVMIRWSLQKGFITIPKSSKDERIVENCNVFDFALDERDMKALSVMPQHRCSWAAIEGPWLG